MKKYILWVAALCAAVWSYAEVPQLFNYQGRLVDGTNLVNGTKTMVFRLYNGLLAGDLVYVETQNVEVVDGLYATRIGVSPDLGTLAAAVTNMVLTLEVQVGGTVLAPRERVAAVAYALEAAGVGPGVITANMIADNAVSSNKIRPNAVGQSELAAGAVDTDEIVDGAVTWWKLQDVYWKVNGNAGTTGGVNFVGTTDSQPLDLRVNGQRALRLEPNATGPNVIGGYAGNVVSGGIYSATISGGGSAANELRVSDHFGTIGGGWNNSAGNDNADFVDASGATVGGGAGNRAGAFRATVGGGTFNVATGQYATVPGGVNNTAGGQYSLAAGRRAKAYHQGAFVWADSTDADFATTTPNQFLIRAGGGVGIGTNGTPEALTVAGNVKADEFIGSWMGQTNPAGFVLKAGDVMTGALTNQQSVSAAAFFNLNNSILAGNSFALGGSSNSIAAGATYGTIGGGRGNAIGDNAPYATVAGGSSNRIRAGSDRAAIGGGIENEIRENSFDATIGGGHRNTISSNCDYSTIGGGYFNLIVTNAGMGTIAGGWSNSIGWDAACATIGGGRDNQVGHHSDYATVAGGCSNVIDYSAWFSTIGGGCQNAIGYHAMYAYAAGHRAHANHMGSFVWADGQDADIASSFTNEVTFRCSKGVRFLGTDATGQRATWQPGDLGWNITSDRNLKEHLEPVDSAALLQQVAALPVTRWKFIGHDDRPHIGPVAQDFNAAFGLGRDPTMIDSGDLQGVCLAAIQALARQNAELRSELDAIKAQLVNLPK